MIILGVDPGTQSTGYGLIEKNGARFQHIDNGLIALNKNSPISLKLKKIFEDMGHLIQHFQPHEIALEDIFMAKNAKSSLKLGLARGIILLAAANHGIPVFEYPPAQVKQAVTGFGRATKEQMQKMVRLHLKLKEIAQEDATDALAVALCHCQTMRYEVGSTKYETRSRK